MPVGEIAGELLGGLFRFLGHVLIEVVLEVLIKGLGYLVCRPFSKSVKSDGGVVTLVGVLTWVVIVAAIFIAYNYFSSMGAGVAENA